MHVVETFGCVCLPKPHSTHVWTLLAPVVVEYLPFSQFIQVLLEVAAVASEYLPVSQLSHVVDDIGEYLPLSQAKHVLASVAFLCTEYFPAAQSMQGRDPATVLYLPGSHDIHVLLINPMKPWLQIQALKVDCDTSACPEFNGH